MKSTLTLFVALALATPLAAAGGADVSLRYLESSDPDCSSESSYDGDSNWSYDHYPGGGYSYSGYSWWSYSDSSSCRAEFETASVDVRDDSGSLASARVHGSDSSNNSYSDQSSYSGWGYHLPGGNTSWGEGQHSGHSGKNRQYQSGSAWDRSTDASVAGHEVHAGRGCAYSNAASENSWSSSYSRHSDGDYSSSSYDHSRSSRSYGHSCSDGANAAGASAGAVSQCSFQSRSEDQSSTWSGSYGSSNSSSSMESSDDVCRQGVAAGKGDAAAFAGSRWTCTEQSWESRYTDESTGMSYRECVNDLVRVDGPDGMVVAAGTWQRSGTDCRDGECSWWSYDTAGIRIEWAHSPLGPNGVSFYHPLP